MIRTTQNVQWPLWPTKKLMESEVRFAMPGIGFTGPGTLFGKAAQIGRFFFCLKKPAALTKYVVGADKNSHWHWLAFGNAQSAIATNILKQRHSAQKHSALRGHSANC